MSRDTKNESITAPGGPIGGSFAPILPLFWLVYIPLKIILFLVAWQTQLQNFPQNGNLDEKEDKIEKFAFLIGVHQKAAIDMNWTHT